MSGLRLLWGWKASFQPLSKSELSFLAFGEVLFSVLVSQVLFFPMHFFYILFLICQKYIGIFVKILAIFSLSSSALSFPYRFKSQGPDQVSTVHTDLKLVRRICIF